MARYKPDQRAQDQMFALNLLDQLPPGTLEHATDYLVDAKVGTAPFDARYVRVARLGDGPLAHAAAGVLLAGQDRGAEPGEAIV